MGSLLKLSRRGLVKLGVAAPFSGLLAAPAFGQDAGAERGTIGAPGGRAEEQLFPAKGLPGGGQLEIRLSATIHTSDPDQLEVAQRLRPLDLESWIAEWTRVAEKN